MSLAKLKGASGEAVATYRKMHRLTQAEAAEKWGCSERQWRRYEKGESVSLPLLKRIASGRDL